MDFSAPFDFKSGLLEGPQRTAVFGADISVKLTNSQGTEGVAGRSLQESRTVTPVPRGFFDQYVDFSGTASKKVQTHLSDRVFVNDRDQKLCGGVREFLGKPLAVRSVRDLGGIKRRNPNFLFVPPPPNTQTI